MKRLLLIVLLLSFTHCKKENATRCYKCTTYNVREYEDGTVKKDTATLEPCQTDAFIQAYLKDGNFDGQNYEIKSGDTIFYHLKAVTTCASK